jgi:hypothetical protein
MSLAELDALFPYVCFVYGAIMTFALHSPTLAQLADTRLPHDLVQRWRAHGPLALLSLGIGTAWILQNLWLT